MAGLSNEWMDQWLTERILKLAYELEMGLISKDKRASHLERIAKLLEARDKLRESFKREKDERLSESNSPR